MAFDNKQTTPSETPSGQIRQILYDLQLQCRDAVLVTDEPQGQALFQTTAEVLGRLVRTYDDYARADDPAWKGAGTVKQKGARQQTGKADHRSGTERQRRDGGQSARNKEKQVRH